jgi:ribonuclease D
VREESAQLAEGSLAVGPPETAYLDIKGWKSLRGAQLAALVGLAAWRRREALAHNKPPSWIVPDAALLELARRRPGRRLDLRAIRGIGDGTVRRYGDRILAAIADRARDAPPAAAPGRAATSARAEVWGAVIASLIHARCAAEQISPHYVGTREEAEELARWHEAGGRGEPPALLTGWRREFVGEHALAWLRGERALRVGGPGGPALEVEPRG